MRESENNKQLAVSFLELVVAGKIDEAYNKHVDMSGKHHNAYFAAGFPALRQAMKDNDQQFPNKRFVIKNVLGDGNLVAVHSHVIVDPGKMELAAVHLLRFAQGKIIEMWDIGQPIPADLPNNDGMF